MNKNRGVHLPTAAGTFLVLPTCRHLVDSINISSNASARFGPTRIERCGPSSLSVATTTSVIINRHCVGVSCGTRSGYGPFYLLVSSFCVIVNSVGDHFPSVVKGDDTRPSD